MMRQCFRPEASKSVLLNHPCVWRASFPGTPPGRGCSTELEDRIMPDLLYEVNNHLARITMNRPEHLNCFSEEMIRLWTAALEDIRDRALDMFWTARVLKGAEAERIGLVTHTVPDDELDEYVEHYMQKLLEAPQQAMRLTKRAINESEQSSLRSSLDMVSSFMGIVTELDDYRTRTAALVEKLNRKSRDRKD